MDKILQNIDSGDYIMKKQKLTTPLLLAAILLPACGESATVSTDTTKAEVTATAAPVVTEAVDPVLEMKDNYFASIAKIAEPGAEITFLSETGDIVVEEETGAQFNDAIWYRNLEIEEKLGIKIKCEERDNDGSSVTITRTAVQAGDGSYDVVNIWTHNAATLFVNGSLQDVTAIPNLQMDKEWWNQNANKASTFAGHTFCAISSLNHYTSAVSEIVMVNKNLCTAYGMEVPYEAVREGTWTFDMMNEMIAKLPLDSNGDAVIDHNDLMGLVGQNVDVTASMVASGVDYFVKDENDIPQYILNTEENFDKFSMIFNMFNDKTRTIVVDTRGIDEPWHYWEFHFKEGNALFMMNYPGNLYAFAEMEDDYGILPMPKYSAEQAEYRTMSSPWFTSCLVFPKVFDANPSDVGTTVDALSFLSYVDVEPTYAASYLESRYIRDEDSVEMMRIATGSTYYDPCFVLNYQLNDAMTSLQTIVRNGTNTFSSYVAKLAPSYTKLMDKLASNIAKNMQ